MTPGSYEEAAQLLVDVGFVGWQIVVMGAIGYAESNLKPHAINLNDHAPDTAAYLSVDWGVWQINDYWQTSLLVARGILNTAKPVGMQLLDPLTNARAAREVFVSRGGERDPVSAYNAWTTFKTSAYIEFRPAAVRAARAIGVPV